MHQKLPSDVTSIQPHFHQGVSMIIQVITETPSLPSQASLLQVTPQHFPCIQTALHQNLGQASRTLGVHTWAPT